MGVGCGVVGSGRRRLLVFPRGLLVEVGKRVGSCIGGFFRRCGFSIRLVVGVLVW